MLNLKPNYINWQVVDINEEPYVVFTAIGVEEDQNRPYTYIRRIAQLTVEDTEG